MPMETIQEYQSPNPPQNKTMTSPAFQIISPVPNKIAKGSAPERKGSNRKLTNNALKLQQKALQKMLVDQNGPLGRQAKPSQPSRT